VPELPDIELYRWKLESLLTGEPLEEIKIFTPFLLRSVDPPVKSLEGKRVTGVRRLGKRLVLAFEDDLYLIVHLMIAGRFQWKSPAPEGRPAGKIGLAMLRFLAGALILTEAGSKKRASLTVARGEKELLKHDPGGKEISGLSLSEFSDLLTEENHTVKRVLTNPHVFSGVGNAYSDEILHHARLSPLKMTKALSPEEIERLLVSTVETLEFWKMKLREQFANKFPGPGDVTAFRPDFAVHGRFGKPCPVCGKPVQRICYADNECNYCAVCQNGGRILADRSLSRLLKDDWPRTFEDPA
jgi:formamidopyrimidine-DNA glycosylase